MVPIEMGIMRKLDVSKTYPMLISVYREYLGLHLDSEIREKKDDKFWFDWLHENCGITYELTDDGREIHSISVTNEELYVFRLLKHDKNK